MFSSNSMLPVLRQGVRFVRPQHLVSLPRFFSTAITEREQYLSGLLREQLEATNVEVVDISGGCGSMYDIKVESPQFVGKTVVKQHRMVNEVLEKEIKDMHGLTIKTSKPTQ